MPDPYKNKSNYSIQTKPIMKKILSIFILTAFVFQGTVPMGQSPFVYAEEGAVPSGLSLVASATLSPALQPIPKEDVRPADNVFPPQAKPHDESRYIRAEEARRMVSEENYAYLEIVEFSFLTNNLRKQMRKLRKGRKGLIINILHRKFPSHYQLDSLYEMLLDLEVVDYLVREPFEDEVPLDLLSGKIKRDFVPGTNYDKNFVLHYQGLVKEKSLSFDQQIREKDSVNTLMIGYDKELQEKIQKIQKAQYLEDKKEGEDGLKKNVKYVSSASKIGSQIARWIKEGRRVGVTVGSFDVIHHGHNRFLRNAKENLGKRGRLVVLVNSDLSASEQPKATRDEIFDRPIHEFRDRVELLSEFPHVDLLGGYDEMTASKVLKKITKELKKLNGSLNLNTGENGFYFIKPLKDRSSAVVREEEAMIQEVGGETRYIDIPTYYDQPREVHISLTGILQDYRLADFYELAKPESFPDFIGEKHWFNGDREKRILSRVLRREIQSILDYNFDKNKIEVWKRETKFLDGDVEARMTVLRDIMSFTKGLVDSRTPKERREYSYYLTPFLIGQYIGLDIGIFALLDKGGRADFNNPRIGNYILMPDGKLRYFDTRNKDNKVHLIDPEFLDFERKDSYEARFDGYKNLKGNSWDTAVEFPNGFWVLPYKVLSEGVRWNLYSEESTKNTVELFEEDFEKVLHYVQYIFEGSAMATFHDIRDWKEEWQRNNISYAYVKKFFEYDPEKNEKARRARRVAKSSSAISDSLLQSA